MPVNVCLCVYVILKIHSTLAGWWIPIHNIYQQQMHLRKESKYNNRPLTHDILDFIPLWRQTRRRREQTPQGIFTDNTAVQKSGGHGIVAAIPALGPIQKNPIHSA